MSNPKHSFVIFGAKISYKKNFYEIDGWCQFHRRFKRDFFKQVFWAAFFSTLFGFDIFWRKNIGTKDTRKMFMKLTKGQQESDNNNQMILLNDVYTV